MAEQDATSYGHLDDLLAQGRITARDYQTLRGALESEEAAGAFKKGAATPRLTKSRADRQLGGVCAGIAARAGIEASTVRLLFLLGVFASAGAAILAYLALFIVLPWDQDVSVLKDRKGRFPWLFITVFGAEASVLRFLMVFQSHHVIEVFSDIGAQLTGPTQLALTACGVFGNFTMGFVVYPMAVVLVAGVYLWLPSGGKGRRLFGLLVVFGLLLCIVALLRALYVPIAALEQSV